MQYSYIDYLREEIEILQLMLYRDEFLTADAKDCNHCGPILNKLDEDQRELSFLENQTAA